MSPARRDPSFSAPFDRLVNRDRIDGISEARAGIRLKNGARTGRQATQIERLNSMDTGEVSLEFSRERGNTEGGRAYSRACSAWLPSCRQLWECCTRCTAE